MTAPTRTLTPSGGVRTAAGVPAAPGRAASPPLARRLVGRLRSEWLPGAAWAISRTGRPGLAGLALLAGAALFTVTTHLQVAAEVEALRADLEVARQLAPAPVAADAAGPASAVPALPARLEMPAILGVLFEQAARARLSVDTARYEAAPVSPGGMVRYQIAFPVRGAYPQIRAFLDETLAAMPAVALGDLVLERKSIGDASVEAQLRLVVYTRSAP